MIKLLQSEILLEIFSIELGLKQSWQLARNCSGQIILKFFVLRQHEMHNDNLIIPSLQCISDWPKQGYDNLRRMIVETLNLHVPKSKISLGIAYKTNLYSTWESSVCCLCQALWIQRQKQILEIVGGNLLRCELLTQVERVKII